MSVNNVEDDALQSKSLDVLESPRKRMRTDNSSRKSWSLMDRRTDQEVLQDMGLSVLDPDDLEAQGSAPGVTAGMHKPLKRKHDIENVSPNVNLVTSPLRSSSKSPRTKCSPGPSKGRSPRSTDKAKPNQSSELDSTLQTEYVIDEETPLAQSVSAQFRPEGSGFAGSVTSSGGKRRDFAPLGLVEEMIINRRSRCEPQGDDSFQVLSDEMMLSIFKWLPKRTLAHCMLVCKRWHRVSADETLWQRLDLGNKVLTKGAVGRVLSRKPIIVRLAFSEIGEWHPADSPIHSRIQYLDLSVTTIDCATLNALLTRCPLLRKLSLENARLQEATCRIIGKCSNIETLNLTMAQGLTAAGLTAVLEGCKNLQALNVAWCSLQEDALEATVALLPPRLQRLNIGGAKAMTDDMVTNLVDRCPRLLELDLSDCSRLGVPAVSSVLALSRLEHLALSRCYLLPPHALTKVVSMSSLQYLEVWGMLQTAALCALKAALPGIQVNQFMFSAIARPTVGARRTSVWGLRTRD